MYFEIFTESLTEAEIISNEEAIKIHSIHPYEIISDKENVIHEAIISKDKIDAAIMKSLEIFISLTAKMRKVAFELKKRNGKWFDAASRFDINRANLNDFKYEIYDYREGIKRIENTKTPVFKSINIQDFSGNAETFKQTYFKDLYLKNEDGQEEISKNYFRGGPEKIELNGTQAKELFRFALDWLKNYENFCRNIESTNVSLNDLLKSSLENKNIITESTILNESFFKNEYYDLLLEDAVDPKDIENEEKDRSNGIDSNRDENQKNKEINDMKEAIKKYWKVCSSIQTMKMDVAKEAYTAFTDFIDRVMNK